MYLSSWCQPTSTQNRPHAAPGADRREIVSLRTVTDSQTNWTAAGHGVHDSFDLNPETSVLAAAVNLPGGFGLIAQDPEFGPAIATGLAKVEKLLRDAIANSDPLIDATSRHLVEAGGKRIRPLLVILASLLGDGVTEDVIKAAAIVELTHLATLYHDDVMDSAPLRRGAPTAHEVWGNSVAILTGDLIFARASVLGAELGPEAVHHAGTHLRATRAWASCTNPSARARATTRSSTT